MAYADCGTQGAIDAFLARVREERGIPAERLPGAHCYVAYAGEEVFEALAAEEPGTFYLTDFLVRHFERLVLQGLGLDRHPQLQPVYFAHYRRVVYLAQVKDAEVLAQARAIAARLDLAFELRFTGYGELAALLQALPGRTLSL